MGTRLELQEELASVAGPSFRVYYQPPVNVEIEYPCIMYELDRPYSRSADNLTYAFIRQYQLTVITRDADCDLPERLVKHFPLCREERTFVSDNLYHTILNIYF